jgi:hypothetical protein
MSADPYTPVLTLLNLAVGRFGEQPDARLEIPHETFGQLLADVRGFERVRRLATGWTVFDLPATITLDKPLRWYVPGTNMEFI